MTTYNITHPKCGAAWVDICDRIPKRAKCKNCREWFSVAYIPLMYAIMNDKSTEKR